MPELRCIVLYGSICIINMKEEPLNITDKETLKITLNQVEMANYTPQRDSSHPDATIRPEDELERKSRLLEQRMKILEETKVKTWRELFPIFNIIAILSLSGMQLGYGLIEITAIYDLGQLMLIYGFGHPIGLSLGAMVGFMPLGAIFGKIFGRCMFSRMPNKTAHHVNNILCMISSFCLMQINFQTTLLLGRFLYGWCIACYCCWSPLYIQDLIPINLKNFTRSIYSLWVVGSMMLGYFFGLVFYENGVQNYYRIMFCFPGILALIQLIMMAIFVPHSPSELFRKQLYEEGRQVLEQIYTNEFIDMMVDRYRLAAEVRGLEMTTLVNEDRVPYRYGRFRARFMGIYLNIFRQFTGINSVLVYAGIIIGQTNTELGPYTNFTLTLIGFIGTIASHLFIVDRCGRRIIMLLSATVFSVGNIIIMVGMLLSNSTMIFIAMIVEILFFGITYSTVSSIYPAEILKNEQASYTSLTAWPAMLLVTLIPPVVADVVSPTHTPWPVFLFYSLYSVLSIFYLWFCAVESKDRQYYDIIKQF